MCTTVNKTDLSQSNSLVAAPWVNYIYLTVSMSSICKLINIYVTNKEHKSFL